MPGTPAAAASRRNLTPALPFSNLTLRGSRPPPEGIPRESETLADHIRRRRYELGLTQREVAERIGVSADTVKNWEAGRTRPGVPYGPKIVDFLGYFPLAWPPDFPARLTLLRWRLGFTQRELAERLEVDETTVASWERGEHRPIGRYRELTEALHPNGFEPPANRIRARHR